MGFEAKQELVG